MQYTVTPPYKGAKPIILEGPEGATEEELQAAAAEEYNSSEQGIRMSAMQHMLQADELKNATSNPADSMGVLEQLGVGNTAGWMKAGRGIRQGWNSMTGDDEELAKLNAEEDRISQQDAALNKTPFAGAGGFIGQLAPSVAAGMAAPEVAVPAAMGKYATTLTAALRAGTGAVGGLMSGQNSALTTEQEAGGGRASARNLGAVLGGGLPTAISSSKLAYDQFRKLGRELPDEAILRFSKELGLDTRTTSIKDLRQAVDQKFAEVKDASDEAYALHEQNPNLAKVPMNTTRGALNSSDSLAYELGQIGDPRLTKMVDAVKNREALSFADARAAQRILKGKGRHDLAGLIDQDLGEWALGARHAPPKYGSSSLPDTDGGGLVPYRGGATEAAESGAKNLEADALAGARAQDEIYKDTVAPFLNKTDLGKFYGKTWNTQFPLGGEKRFMKPEAGVAVEDLLTRVPDARVPIRGLYASGIDDALAGGTTDSTRKALTQPATESFLTAAEQARARQLAESLRKGDDGKLAKAVYELPLMGNYVDRFLNGVEKEGFKGNKTTNILPSFMLGYGVNSGRNN